MTENLSLLISIIAIVVSLVVVLATYSRLRSVTSLCETLQTHIQSNELLINQLQNSISECQKQLILLKESLESDLLENEQVSKQLEHRIKALKQDIAKQSEQLEQLKQQQPEDKLYSRAQKLVALGADVSEIVSECELPLAEAEMLVALYRKNNPAN